MLLILLINIDEMLLILIIKTGQIQVRIIITDSNNKYRWNVTDFNNKYSWNVTDSVNYQVSAYTKKDEHVFVWRNLWLKYSILVTTRRQFVKCQESGITACVVLMLGQRRRRWPNTKTTPGHSLIR